MKKIHLVRWSLFAFGLVCGLIIANTDTFPSAKAGNGNGNAIGKGGIPGLIDGLDERISAAEADIDDLGVIVAKLEDASEAESKRISKAEKRLAKLQNAVTDAQLDIIDILIDVEKCCEGGGGGGCSHTRRCPPGQRCCPDGTCIDERLQCRLQRKH